VDFEPEALNRVQLSGGAPIESDGFYRRSRPLPVGEYTVLVMSKPGGGI